MSRRPRPRTVLATNQFEADMGKVHELLYPYMRDVDPGGDHGKALRYFHASLLALLETVTGHSEPPWVRNRGNTMEAWTRPGG